jgi:hypothetical protein
VARLPEPAPPGVAARLVAGEGEAQILELTLPASDARTVAPDLFFEPHKLVDLKRPETFSPEGGGSGFRVPFRPFDETKPLPDRLSFAWTATGFERAGKPLAWEGSIEAERSVPNTSSALIVTVAAAIAVLVAVGFALQRRSQTAARST